MKLGRKIKMIKVNISQIQMNIFQVILNIMNIKNTIKIKKGLKIRMDSLRETHSLKEKVCIINLDLDLITVIKVIRIKIHLKILWMPNHGNQAILNLIFQMSINTIIIKNNNTKDITQIMKIIKLIFKI